MLCCFAWVAQRQYLSTLQVFSGFKGAQTTSALQTKRPPIGPSIFHFPTQTVVGHGFPLGFRCLIRSRPDAFADRTFVPQLGQAWVNARTTTPSLTRNCWPQCPATWTFPVRTPACLAVHHAAPASPSMATALTSSLQKASSKFLHSFMCIDPWTKLHFLRYTKYTCFISKCFHIFHINYNCCQAAPISPFDCLY